MKPTGNGVRTGLPSTGLKTAPRAAPAKGKPVVKNAPSPWPKRLLILAAALVLLGGITFAFFQLRPDPMVAQVKQLQVQAKEAFENKDLPMEQKFEAGRQAREAESQLSPKQQVELTAEDRAKREQKMREFRDLSPQDQLAKLNEDLDRMRQQWGGRGFGGGGRPGGGGPGVGGPGAVGAGGGQGAGRPGGGGGPPGGGAPGGGGNPGGGGGPPGAGGNPGQRAKDWIDRMTPEDRAYWHALGVLGQKRGGGGGGPPKGP